MEDERFDNGTWQIRRPTGDRFAEGWPRVAILHSFYRAELPSGENQTVLRQYGWLAEAGVDVALISVSTDELSRSSSYTLRTAGRVAFGVGTSPRRVLEEINPEVVHVHNLFPNLSSSWIPTSRWAVVVSLHNYRPLCAAATLSREGKECRLCLDRGPIHGLLHRCYRDSAVATAPLTVRALARIDSHQVLKGADVLTAPSEIVREAYHSAGVNAIQVLLQPTSDRWGERSTSDVEGFVFVGRLTPEKGIMRLLSVWPADLNISIIGQGPLEEEARALARRRGLLANFAGRVSDESLAASLRSSAALVFPSTWREGAPAVYAEALSAGLPVISLVGNAVADFVTRDQTGVVLNRLDELGIRAAALDIAKHAAELRTRCREVYLRDYTKDAWLSSLRQVYGRAISERALR